MVENHSDTSELFALAPFSTKINSSKERSPKDLMVNCRAPSPDLTVVRDIFFFEHIQRPKFKLCGAITWFSWSYFSIKFLKPLCLLMFPIPPKSSLSAALALCTSIPCGVLTPNSTFVAHPCSFLKPWDMIPICNVPPGHPI
jgi:hypothetical protein